MVAADQGSWPPPTCGRARASDRAGAGRVCDLAARRPRHRQAARPPPPRSDCESNLPERRRSAQRRRRPASTRTRANPGSHWPRRSGRLLSWADRRRHDLLSPQPRRIAYGGRFRSREGRIRQADRDRVSGKNNLRMPAERPGRRRFDDPEHPIALQGQAGSARYRQSPCRDRSDAPRLRRARRVCRRPRARRSSG